LPDLEALLDDNAGVLVSDGSASMLIGMVTTDFADAGRSYGGADRDTVFQLGDVAATFCGRLDELAAALGLSATTATTSTADDLGVWLQAQCNPSDWPMTDEICALDGWDVRESPWPLTWKTGAADGDAVFIGWHPPTGAGVVLLARTPHPRALFEAAEAIIAALIG